MEPVFADRKSVLDYAERDLWHAAGLPVAEGSEKRACSAIRTPPGGTGLLWKSHRNGWGFPVKAPWTS